MSRITVVLDLESAVLDCLPAMAASLCAGIRSAGGATVDEARVGDLLRAGRLATLREELGEGIFCAALASGAQHYERFGQFCAWPYAGVPSMLNALRDAAPAVGVALVSRMPRATVERILERWGLDLPLALVDCPARPSCAQDRRERLSRLVAAGDIDPNAAVCLSDDPLDLECAQRVGVRPLFAAYGRLPWCVCRGDTGSIALSPGQVPRLLGLSQSFSWPARLH